MKAEVLRHEYTTPFTDSRLELTISLPPHINREHVKSVEVEIASPGERLFAVFQEAKARTGADAVVYLWRDAPPARKLAWEDLAKAIGYK